MDGADPYEEAMPLITCASWIIGLGLVHVEYTRFQSSGVLPSWWSINVFMGLWKLREEANHISNDGGDFEFLYSLGWLLLNLALTALSFMPETRSAVVYEPLKDKQAALQPCPETDASWISRLSFWWINPMMALGYRRPLEEADLWDLDKSDKSHALLLKFEKEWTKQRSLPKPSLARAFWKAFGWDFMAAAPLKLAQDSLQFVGPLLLGLMVEFVEDPDKDISLGYIYTLILFSAALIQSVCLQYYFHICFRVGMQLRGAIVTAVYQKSLYLTSAARQTSTVGQIVNLMAVDAQRFMDLTPYCHMLWSAPLQVAVSLYLLWDVVGLSLLAGLFAMLLMVPVNAYFASKMKNLQKAVMDNKDARSKEINEVMTGIKVIKLYAWENSFMQKITGIRNDELESLRRSKYLGAVSNFFFYFSPMLVSMSTFIMYTALGNDLTASKAFTAIALFNILRFPLMMLPMVIFSLVEASVSVDRLQKYFLQEELDKSAVVSVPRSAAAASTGPAVLVRDGTFSWKATEPGKEVLRSVNLTAGFGEVVAVVGEVASGKSSLMEALLGGMIKVSGEVRVTGSVAYVAQQAWITNSTLRDNVLFGRPYDAERYSKVVKACALQQDIDMLPNGDMTEIGEKGINLSGGQKQRVSMARAVYQDTDVYLLDDPLSAVDAHVGAHIFENVIGARGILKDKCRILVTHGISFLPQTDRIVVLKCGQVTESGTYTQLMESNGDFSALILANSTAQQTQDAPDAAGVEGEKKEKTPAVTTKSAPALPAAAPAKLISAEDRETGEVDPKVYWAYLRANGVPLSIAVATAMTIQQLCNIGNNVWLSEWTTAVSDAEDDSQADDVDAYFYLGIYVGLGLGQALFVLFGSFLLAAAGIESAKKMHEDMLESIMRAPMRFF
eukprot:TRINITY_DN4565_c0_g1_i3.p1 TRINITY_DN4565_c0_g1~~TRINITY_DN4565_c0_g1_i3.p1  ORF type:complete len:991 (-),score=281.77 TRINITY_DN4565_c0_g1_i3:1492-4185(-)